VFASWSIPSVNVTPVGNVQLFWVPSHFGVWLNMALGDVWQRSLSNGTKLEFCEIALLE
jgi:hypothetical protein